MPSEHNIWSPFLMFYSFGSILCPEFDTYIVFKLASQEKPPPRAIARVLAI